MKRVVIIGGGYAGASLARRLDDKVDVTLINRTEAFFHKVASLRAAVDPAWTIAPLIPYTHLLQNGKFMKGEVIDINTIDKRVSLASGHTIAFDIAVIATGSDYPEPANFGGTNIAEAKGAMISRQSKIETAKHIAVIGGGPAGVEFVGEIRDRYPSKVITLIHGDDVLLRGNHTSSLGKRAQHILERKRVRVVLNEKVSPTKGTLTLSTGEKITADLVYWTIGAKPNSDWLRALHTSWLDHNGRIIVNTDLHVAGEALVYAIGDITNTHEVKKTESAKAQAKAAAENILLQFAGKPTKPYHEIRSEMMIVPIGASDGVSLFPFGKSGMVAGARITSMISGKKLFIGKWRKFFRLEKVHSS